MIQWLLITGAVFLASPVAVLVGWRIARREGITWAEYLRSILY